VKGQHEPLWKPEVKSGAPEGKASPAPHAAPVRKSPDTWVIQYYKKKGYNQE